MSYTATERQELAMARIPLVLACCVGWFAAMTHGFSFWAPYNWPLFTQLACLTVLAGQLVTIIDLLCGARFAMAARLVRGGALVYSTITMIIYATLLGADYSSWGSSFEHLIVPVLAWFEWLLLPPLRRMRWWAAPVWAVAALSYLPLYIAASRVRKLYPFLDPEALSFWPMVGVMVLCFVGLGLVVCWASSRPDPILAGAAHIGLPTTPQSPDVAPLANPGDHHVHPGDHHVHPGDQDEQLTCLRAGRATPN